jgi:hypothetical protein
MILGKEVDMSGKDYKRDIPLFPERQVSEKKIRMVLLSWGMEESEIRRVIRHHKPPRKARIRRCGGAFKTGEFEPYGAGR